MASTVRRPRYDSMRSSTSDVGWRPPSPTFSTTTTGSRVNAPAGFPIISRKDLRQSIACLEELMAAAKAYRNALLAMSEATAAFAQAMEACSRVKGCREANSSLSGASALQHLLANHDQLLADTVYRQFEIPLLSALDEYKLLTADRLASYEKSLSDQSAKIRKTEAQNLRDGRRRKRDLNAFRAALAELQRQVEELDGIKMGYHEEVLEGEGEIWDTVLAKVAFVVRSQLDFYEKIASKASDPILEPLVMSIPDPFDSYGPPKEDGQIFSVLAPLGMLDSTPGSPTPALTRSATSPTLKSPSGSRHSSAGHGPVVAASGNGSSSSSGRASPTKSYGTIGSRSKGVPFPSMSMSLSMSPTPARAEIGTSAVSALGFHADRKEKEGGKGAEDVDDEERAEGRGDNDDGASRARRELSVIEERANEALSPTKSVRSVNTPPADLTADEPTEGVEAQKEHRLGNLLVVENGRPPSPTGIPPDADERQRLDGPPITKAGQESANGQETLSSSPKP